MVATSAGLLLYRLGGSQAEVLVAHMGGPYWASKDDAAWSIPKGEYDPSAESPADAAVREFREELGVDPPEGTPAELGTWAYSSGKRITVFVVDGSDFGDPDYAFGTFELEWPPRSGTRAEFPEVDRAEWMPLEVARVKLVKGQRSAIDALEKRLAEAS